MIYRSFGPIRMGFHICQGVPEINFPRGFLPGEEEENPPDITLEFRVGEMKREIPTGAAKLTRGRMAAYGTEEQLTWVHLDIGPFIHILPVQGKVEVSLPQWAWHKVTDMLDQVLLPCLLPPFAARGLRAIHASSVEVNGAGVLITGESGSGKTTSALKVVENGGRLIADDMTFFSRHDGDTFVIHGMGEAPRARKEVWEQFKQWSPVPRKRSSKLILKSDDLPWSKEAPLKRMIILVERDSGENYKVKLLTTLLSLTYLGHFGPTAVKSLMTMTNTVDVFFVNRPDLAASLALGHRVNGMNEE